MTPRYPCLLFDADDTLLDFRAAEAAALAGSFVAAGVAFDPAWGPVYHVVNARAWRALEEGRTTAKRLRVERFEALFAELRMDLDPGAFSVTYLAALGRQAQLVAGARELLAAVRPAHRIAIVTNGLSDVQRPRLAASGIDRLVDAVVISEEVGVAKPDPRIFEIALGALGRPHPAGCLVIGDSLRSDIAGGIAAGLDTCWYNPAGLRPEAPLAPTHEIARLDDLQPIVGAARAAAR